MKFATLTGPSAGLVVVDATGQSCRRVKSVAGQPVADMNALIERAVATGGDLNASVALDTTSMRLDNVRFAAAMPRPRRNIMCVGKNYFDHAHEFAKSGFDSSATKPSDAVPTAPIVFTKMPETVIASGVPVRFPEGVSAQLDYEAELGVIIGKGGRGIAKADALTHVFGYVIINDVTARDLQARHKQWFIGKSLDTFCPMGQWIATADELDGTQVDVKCWINGELRQQANTRDLIFDIPTLIETLSAGLTLMPGDVIATGTPAGVGIGFTPPRFLVRGDRMDIEIDGLGRLSNTVE